MQSLEIQLRCELDRPRRVALREDLSELARAPVGVRVTEEHPVEGVAELRLQTEFDAIGDSSVLDQTEVLTESRKTACCAVAPRRVTEGPADPDRRVSMR
jgi:hypothetical protein